MQSTTAPLILSLLVIAAFALAGGGTYLLARRRDRTRGVLMILCALVFLANAAILSL